MRSQNVYQSSSAGKGREDASPVSSSAVGLEDLTLLGSLSEQSINDNLKLRFNRNLIYTNIGNVLLSVNPYKPISFLYEPELIEFYKRGGKERSVSNVLVLQRQMREKMQTLLRANNSNGNNSSGALLHQRFGSRRLHSAQHGASAITAILQNKSLLAYLSDGGSSSSSGSSGSALTQAFPYLAGGPHIFQLANTMYNALLTEEENQTVIISGESGAGKTEASKQVLQFVSYISAKQRGGAYTATVGRQNKRRTLESSDGEEDHRAGSEKDHDGADGKGAEEAGDNNSIIEKIKEIILESNPLMEAFGNAKTVKNDNSSRFGKFFEIYFPQKGGPDAVVASPSGPSLTGSGAAPGSSSSLKAFYGLPVGGHMSIFLLEKTRVVQQQYGERNFHIFYQLLAGLDAETKAQLHLDIFDGSRKRGGGEEKGFFNYLNSGRTTAIDRVDDREEFAKTLHAMRVVGISETVQRFVFEVLAAILHLGELEFVDASGLSNEENGGEDEGEGGRRHAKAAAVTGSEVCRVRNRETLQRITSLLKLDDTAALEKALTTKTLEIGEKGGEGSPGGSRKDVQVLEVPLDLAGCRHNRDAVAKLLYDSVFNFVVFFVNSTLTTASAFTSADGTRKDGERPLKEEEEEAEEDEGIRFRHFAESVRRESLEEQQQANTEKYLTLGVLDIYGFEIFANNSFEQFCINYINEKLHQIFIDLTLKREQEEYKSEGITLPHKIDTFFDNKRILHVIEGTTGGSESAAAAVPGIFQLLDDICVSLAKEPEHIADAKFLEKLDLFLSRSPAAAPYFQKNERSGFFTVKHYAGNVTYNVNGFVSKNRDSLSNTLLRELRKTTHSFVKEILAPTLSLLEEAEAEAAAGRGGAKRRTGLFMSSGKKLCLQAAKLVAKLRSSNIHYIRTIKPNEEKKSEQFVDECVLHQIQYLGLMENIEIRKTGFIYRNYFDVFLRRFYLILSQMNERMKWQQYSPYHDSGGHRANGAGLVYQEPFNFLEHDDKESCRVLLTFVESEAARCQLPERRGDGEGVALPAKGFEQGCWQLGRTKVFIRQPIHLLTLERLREACVEGHARKIQRCYRSYRNEKANILLKQKMTRLYTKGGKARRADSVFRMYSGDYLDIKSASAASRVFQYNGLRNHHDLLRILRYDPLAVGWRALFSERDGRFYYVNLFTQESTWLKPPAMSEMELYHDSNAADGVAGDNDGPSSYEAAAAFQPVNVEGVSVVFSSKVERVLVVAPVPLWASGASESERASEKKERVAAPYCAVEEILLVVTNKAVFLFKESVSATTVSAGRLSGEEDTAQSSGGVGRAADTHHKGAAPRRNSATTEAAATTTTSRLVLVKRVDLRLLRGITVSPFADDYLYLHVYPQLEPYRPVFASNGRGRDDAAADTADSAAAKRSQRREKGKAASGPPPRMVVSCDCCGRRLTPAASRAHCPCCGRLCCTRTCLPSSFGGGEQRRPLPTLLGSNVVNLEGLKAVVARRQADLAAVAARTAAREKLRRRSSQEKSSKHKHATIPEDDRSANRGNGGDGADEDDDGYYYSAASRAITLEEVALLESVPVCPWCVHLEPLEINEDVVLKTFLRTELAAFLLKGYKKQMGFPLPFRIAKQSIQLILAVNKELERRVQAAAAAAAPRNEGPAGERKLLAALADGERRDSRGSSSSKRKKSAPPPLSEAQSAFSSYRTVTVRCDARPEGSADEESYLTVERTTPVVVDSTEHFGVDCPAVFRGDITLTSSAPPGIAKSAIAAFEAKREERRRAFETRRREEDAALRAKADAKAVEREETYARLVEEKKRDRREKAAQERSARLWKEEEQRRKREAAALAVAERAKRGPQ